MKTLILQKTRLLSAHPQKALPSLLAVVIILALMPVSAHAAEEQSQIINAFCPVMTDMQTNPDIFYVYQGEKVYFCCMTCRASFKKNPEKYLTSLQQVTNTTEGQVQIHNHRQHIGRGIFIKPTGILTISLLITTVLVGFYRKKNPKFMLKWHKRLGVITAISALTHAALILSIQLFPGT